jgi:hypothetical protein
MRKSKNQSSGLFHIYFPWLFKHCAGFMKFTSTDKFKVNRIMFQGRKRFQRGLYSLDRTVD